MSSITVRVDVDIDPMRLELRADRAANILANQVKSDTERFVPMLTGSLRGRTLVRNKTITYPGPYARYLYNGVSMVDVETGSAYAKRGHSKRTTGKALKYSASGTGDHWFDKSKAVNLERWKRVYRRAIENG